MGAGGGKSSTSQTNSSLSYLSPYFARAAGQIFKSIAPPLQTLSGQVQEGLQTGGVNANIPLINSSLASARSAYSSSYQSLKNNLASSGLLNSSIGQEILGSFQGQGEQAIAGLPSQETASFLSTAAPQVFGAGTSLIGTELGGATGTQGSTTTSTPSFEQSLLSGLNSGSLLGISASDLSDSSGNAGGLFGLGSLFSSFGGGGGAGADALGSLGEVGAAGGSSDALATLAESFPFLAAA